MKYLLLTLFCMALSALPFAQSEILFFPAVSAFMCETVWSCSALSACGRPGYASLFCGTLMPLGDDKAICSTLSGENVGDFRDLSLTASYAQSFADCFSLALSCDYHCLFFSDPFYGRKRGAAVSLYSLFRPDRRYAVGIGWINPFALPYWVEGERREKIPSALRAFVCCSGNTHVLVTLGAEKQWHCQTRFGWIVSGAREVGIQWRIGGAFPAASIMFGAGYAGDRLRYEASCRFKRGWGASVQVSVGSAFHQLYGRRHHA